MRPVKNQSQIQRWVEESGVGEYFDTPHLVFQAYRYEKGEYITSPDVSMDKLLFFLRGSIQIYGIRDDGSISPIGLAQSPAILGDVEFGNGGKSPFYAQAKTDALCLALSTKEYHQQLHRDLRFLHRLLRSYGEKLESFSAQTTVAVTVEQRVLQYLEESSPPAEIDGIEAATLQLRCSRRQQQRVLKKICLQGKIEKMGKGRYRLAPANRED